MADPEGEDATAHGWMTTQWSQVVRAGGHDEDVRRQSLEYLCRHYWQPVYHFLVQVLAVRRSEAEDLTQEFFLHLLEREVIPRAAPEVGRFRHYVKAVLRNFLADRRRFESRKRRGGGRRALSLDVAGESGRLPADPGASPEECLDRRWALRLLEIALEGLASDLRREGREQDLALFQEYLAAREDGRKRTYEDLGEEHGLSEWSVWNKLRTLKERLRLAMAREVGRTVAGPDLVAEEMQTLLELIR